MPLYLTLLAHSPYWADTPFDRIPLPIRYWAIFGGAGILYPTDPIGTLTIELLRTRGIPILNVLPMCSQCAP